MCAQLRYHDERKNCLIKRNIWEIYEAPTLWLKAFKKGKPHISKTKEHQENNKMSGAYEWNPPPPFLKKKRKKKIVANGQHYWAGEIILKFSQLQQESNDKSMRPASINLSANIWWEPRQDTGTSPHTTLRLQTFICIEQNEK